MDEKSIKPYYRLAQAYGSLGLLSQAFETLKNGCEKHPSEPNMRREYDNIQILMSYKESLIKMIENDDFQEALKKVSSILEKCEMDIEMLITKIELLCKTGDPKEALRLLKERENFIESYSQTKIIILFAMVDRYSNKVDDAKLKLQRALSQDPDNDSLKKEMKHILVMESVKTKGNTYFGQRKLEDALIFYDEALRLDPYNNMWKAVLCSNKASCYMGLKNTSKALDLMKESTNFDPNNAKNMYKRGKLEKDMKNWESALDCMRKAKSLDKTLTIDADIKLISEELKKINDRNYYEVMGLPKTATQEEIKKAYKELVRKHHPDKHSGNPEEQAKEEKIFKEVNEANEVLSDPKKKQQYDQNGCKKLDGNERGDFGGFGMDPSEVFSMFFSQGSSFGGQQGAGGAGKQSRHSQGFKFRFG